MLDRAIELKRAVYVTVLSLVLIVTSLSNIINVIIFDQISFLNILKNVEQHCYYILIEDLLILINS